MKTFSEKYDAILVLGTSTDKGLFRFRVEKAVNLYHKGVTNNLIFSGKWWGGLKNKPRHTEAKLMSKYAQELGVPKKNIATETNSLNTIGNFYFTKMLILKPKKIKKLLVITHATHLSKAKYISKKVLGDSYMIKFIIDQNSNTKKAALIHKTVSDIKVFFHNIQDRNDSAIKELLKKHPYYKNFRTLR